MQSNHTTGTLSIIQLLPALLAMVIDAFAFALVYPVMATMFSNVHHGLFNHSLSVGMRHLYLSFGYFLFPLFMFLGATLMGDLSDIFGRKKVLLLCVAGMLISFLLMALGVSQLSIILLLVGRALNGLFAANQPIAQAVVADLSTPSSKARNMKLMSITITVGNILGPIIGGVTSDKQIFSFFNFAIPFYLSAVLCLITLIWVWFSFCESYQQKQTQSLNIWRFVRVFTHAFLRKETRWLALGALLMQIGFSAFYQLIIILLQTQYHYFSWQIGVFNAYIGVCYMLGMFCIYPYMIRHLCLEYATIICFILSAFVYWGLAVTQTSWLIWLFSLPIAIFYIAGFTMLLTLFSNAVAKHEQGWVMGVSTSMMAMAWAITGLSPNLISRYGIRLLIHYAGIAMLCAGLCLYKKYKDSK